MVPEKEESHDWLRTVWKRLEKRRLCFMAMDWITQLSILCAPLLIPKPFTFDRRLNHEQV